VVLTADWHPENHVSFYTYHPEGAPFTKIEVNGQMQELWPPHCVQNTKGAEFHADLVTSEKDILVRKGQAPEHDDSYSGFGKTGV
jgi:nicotinamidase/pyrazinamidase